MRSLPEKETSSNQFRCSIRLVLQVDGRHGGRNERRNLTVAGAEICKEDCDQSGVLGVGEPRPRAGSAEGWQLLHFQFSMGRTEEIIHRVGVLVGAGRLTWQPRLEQTLCSEDWKSSTLSTAATRSS
jgi:hypothetical protein